MNIMVVDDEWRELTQIVNIIKNVCPEDNIVDFSLPKDAIEYMDENSCDVAVLDVEMGGMNGIELAKKCESINPYINIIFITGYSSYALKAFEVHADGYMLKPVLKEQVKKEFEYVKKQHKSSAVCNVRVQTFGNFEIFVDDIPINFARSKSKECLAYLISRRGANCTKTEIAASLWEDRCYDAATQNYTQKVITEMMNALKKAGIDDIIIKTRNNYSVDTRKIKCDYYDFIEEKGNALNTFLGEFMAQYSWAEDIAGMLYEMKMNRI